MILEKGNMWDAFHKTDAFVITTNPIRRKDGAVVMGRGIALEAKTKFPDLPYKFGDVLNYSEDNGNHTFFGKIGRFDSTNIYYFMVKHHWADAADLGLIASSLYYMRYFFNYDDSVRRVDLNMPGVGNGKLPRDKVLYLLEDLSDMYHIWEYAS